jgi:hypothetical protein
MMDDMIYVVMVEVESRNGQMTLLLGKEGGSDPLQASDDDYYTDEIVDIGLDQLFENWMA